MFWFLQHSKITYRVIGKYNTVEIESETEFAMHLVNCMPWDLPSASLCCFTSTPGVSEFVVSSRCLGGFASPRIQCLLELMDNFWLIALSTV